MKAFANPDPDMLDTLDRISTLQALSDNPRITTDTATARNRELDQAALLDHIDDIAFTLSGGSEAGYRSALTAMIDAEAGAMPDAAAISFRGFCRETSIYAG